MAAWLPSRARVSARGRATPSVSRECTLLLEVCDDLARGPERSEFPFPRRVAPRCCLIPAPETRCRRLPGCPPCCPKACFSLGAVWLRDGDAPQRDASGAGRASLLLRPLPSLRWPGLFRRLVFPYGGVPVCPAGFFLFSFLLGCSQHNIKLAIVFTSFVTRCSVRTFASARKEAHTP